MNPMKNREKMIEVTRAAPVLGRSLVSVAVLPGIALLVSTLFAHQSYT